MTTILFSAIAASSNKNMHSDKIKLHSEATQLYFAGDVSVIFFKERRKICLICISINQRWLEYFSY